MRRSAHGRFAVGEPVVDVLGVGARVGELLEALGAHEGLLPAVEPAVLREVVFMFESLVALTTLVGTQI